MRAMRLVARWLGPEAQRIGIAEMLQETAESLRRPYIDYIGRLGVEQDSPGWWFGSLSEKNPGVSRAFLHICYFAVAARLSRKHANAGTLVLVVESPDVRRAIAGSLREDGIHFVEAGASHDDSVLGRVCDWVEMLARKFGGICRQVYRMAVARALGFSASVFHRGHETEERPWILLHNWVDARSFGADGRYRDIFFGPLREELLRRGMPVAVVASVLHKTPYVRLLINLKRSGIPVLVPHATLTLGAILKWGLHLLTRPPRPRVWPRFEGTDVSAILNGDERIDWKYMRVGEVLLIADVVRQWRLQVDIQSFIYTYEGHTWERGYCLAIREHFPQARLVGCQHSTLSQMHLSHFISEAEWGKVPFPDRVVTNGAYHYELLRKNGIPEQALSCGGTFRYGAVRGDIPALAASGSDQSAVRILVAFSVFATQAAELLLAVLEAFSDPRVSQVRLKFHPSLPARRVALEAGIALRSLPSHIQVVGKPLFQLLRDTDVLVYTDTTAAVEALACGIPAVHLLSSHAIDKDRLASFNGARISAGTAEGLKAAVLAVMGASPEECYERSRRWREVVDLLLPPPDEKTIDLFMPDGLPGKRSAESQVAAKVR